MPAPAVLGITHMDTWGHPGLVCVICRSEGIKHKAHWYTAANFDGTVEACGLDHARELIYIYNELDKEAKAESVETALGA